MALEESERGMRANNAQLVSERKLTEKIDMGRCGSVHTWARQDWEQMRKQT